MRSFLSKHYKSNKTQGDEMFGKWFTQTVEAKYIRAQDFDRKS